METEKRDQRIMVKFIAKPITVGEGEQAHEVMANYVSPDKIAHRTGAEELVTRKHAIWLEDNGWIEPLKRQNKADKTKKETK